MSPVSIFEDPYGVVAAGDITVRTQPDLILALVEIEAASAGGRDLVVLLRNQALGRSVLTHLERLPGVHIEQLHPVRNLAAELGVEMSQLPQRVLEDPRFIVQSGLLDQVDAIKAATSASVASAILGVLVGPEWAASRAPTDVNWVARIIVSLAHLTSTSGTLQLIQNDVLREWAQLPHAHPALRVLAESPDLHQLAHAFMCAAALRGYPTHLRLKTTAALLEQAQDIGLDEELLEALVEAWTFGPLVVPKSTSRATEQYLEERLEVEGLSGVKERLGGMLDSEARAIERFMRTCGRLTVDDERIARAFAENLHRHGMTVAAQTITDLIPPSEPKLEWLDADWAHVSDWVTREYFPYYEWSTSSGALVELTDSISAWEHWLAREYADVTWDAERYSPLGVSEALRHFKESGVPVCLVVVDAMSWSGALHLQASIHSRSGQLLKMTPGLAAVPTVTSIAKPAVVRGQKPDQVVLSECAESDYLALFSENIGLPCDCIAMGRSNTSTIDDLLAKKADAFIFFADSIDVLVHQPLSPSIRKRQIHTALADLAEDIVAARDAFLLRTGRHIALVVCADHGFTELPDEAELLEVPAGGVVDHHRVLKSDKTPADCISVAEITKTPFTDDIFVAPRLACFGSRPKGAAHGGMTPQELVVPIGVIDPSIEAGDYQRLVFALDGTVRRGRSDNLVTLHVVNENPAEVCLQSLDVRLAEMRHELPTLLPAGRGLQINGVLDASSITAEEFDVTIQAQGEYLGQIQHQRTIVRVTTTGAATSDSTFEDDFDV